MFYEAYTAPWVNDEFKASSRLTLTFGLRLDYQFARTESKDQYSTFDANTPNPGAGGIPGAIIFAGKGPGRTGGRTFDRPDVNSWGPRFGFAYRLGDRTALRGGYGIYYSGVSFSQFMGQPTLGFSSNPTISNQNNGQSAIFHLDNGFPQNDATLCPGPGNPPNPCIKYPPFIDPTISNGGSPLAVAKNGLTLPRYQNFSLTVERQITNNMRLDVSYIGNRGTRLTNNWQSMGIDANMNDPSVLALGSAVLQSLCDGVTCPGGVQIPYAGFTGDVAQALRKYPQYQGILWRGVPTGSSMYHALEVVLEQRFTRGLQFRVGYTYSKLHNDGAENGQGGADSPVQNPASPHKGEYGLSADDVPHAFLVGYTWEIPGAKRFNSGVSRALLGGWNLAGALRYESGRPLNITMNNDLGGFLFNGQKRPNRAKGVSPVTSRSGNFNPYKQKYFHPEAWEDPGALQFGNAPRRDGSARGFPTYNEDVNLFKVFALREWLKMRFEADFGNIFNRTDFCDPNTNWSDTAGFGRVSTQCNQPRSIQFALRFDF